MKNRTGRSKYSYLTCFCSVQIDTKTMYQVLHLKKVENTQTFELSREIRGIKFYLYYKRIHYFAKWFTKHCYFLTTISCKERNLSSSNHQIRWMREAFAYSISMYHEYRKQIRSEFNKQVVPMNREKMAKLNKEKK